MQYLVSAALLVAVAAWVVAVFNRLNHLRGEVCGAWQQWITATHRRNECLADFASVFALLMPQGDMLPRSLRRLAADSERSLGASPEPHWGASPGFVGGAEAVLRRVVDDSMVAVENSPLLRAHERLQQLSSQVHLSCYQQEQYTRLFNHMAEAYNNALADPSGRLLAPLFGFASAGVLCPVKEMPAPSEEGAGAEESLR